MAMDCSVCFEISVWIILEINVDKVTLSNCRFLVGMHIAALFSSKIEAEIL